MRSTVETVAPVEPATETRSAGEVVLGNGLILNRRGTSYEIHTFYNGRPRPVGNFSSAADAWCALDALDAPFDE